MLSKIDIFNFNEATLIQINPDLFDCLGEVVTQSKGAVVQERVGDVGNEGSALKVERKLCSKVSFVGMWIPLLHHQRPGQETYRQPKCLEEGLTYKGSPDVTDPSCKKETSVLNWPDIVLGSPP